MGEITGEIVIEMADDVAYAVDLGVVIGEERQFLDGIFATHGFLNELLCGEGADIIVLQVVKASLRELLFGSRALPEIDGRIAVGGELLGLDADAKDELLDGLITLVLEVVV